MRTSARPWGEDYTPADRQKCHPTELSTPQAACSRFHMVCPKTVSHVGCKYGSIFDFLFWLVDFDGGPLFDNPAYLGYVRTKHGICSCWNEISTENKIIKKARDKTPCLLLRSLAPFFTARTFKSFFSSMLCGDSFPAGQNRPYPSILSEQPLRVRISRLSNLP